MRPAYPATHERGPVRPTTSSRHGGRVAGELVDPAQSVGGAPALSASYQDLADALGSVREVVGRIVSAFREEGLVERRGSKVVLLDSERLMEISSDETMLAWSNTSYPDFLRCLG
ncbi:MAG TPA: helix-turn-helix domain-containing protein [Solirubrobacteraceae bacterium]|nr:helix-turn-helix domain-containing protein [Solirubrobacteraceae bacterium]